MTLENEMPRWGVSGRFLLNVGRVGIGCSSAPEAVGVTANMVGPCPSSPGSDFLFVCFKSSWNHHNDFGG